MAKDVMNKYRVNINGVDRGVYPARNVDEAQSKALQKLIDEGKEALSYNFVITRENDGKAS